MSRSVKTPIIKQKNSKLSKKQSNRKVRRCDVNYDGKSYKKLCCCYDICDFNTGVLSKNDLDKLRIPEYRARMK